jgi:alpha-tubulin suppressor-like RCC1 family protein
LGVESENEMVESPVKIPLENVIKVIAGYDYSLALTEDGKLWVWGMNRQKWFEDSDAEFVKIPTKLDKFSEIEKLAGSAGHILLMTKK